MAAAAELVQELTMNPRGQRPHVRSPTAPWPQPYPKPLWPVHSTTMEANAKRCLWCGYDGLRRDVCGAMYAARAVFVSGCGGAQRTGTLCGQLSKSDHSSEDHTRAYWPMFGSNPIPLRDVCDGS